MTTYVALLRGIGLGRNQLPMKELVQLLEELGLHDVRTYIQTGNAVFRAGRISARQLADRVTSAIETRHGFAPHTLILTLAQLESVIAANPFAEADAEPKTVHVFFLDGAPKSPDTKTLEALRVDSERFVLQGRAFYLHTPDGFGRSKLATRVEKALGVPATARNWRSVLNIRDLAREAGSA